MGLIIYFRSKPLPRKPQTKSRNTNRRNLRRLKVLRVWPYSWDKGRSLLESLCQSRSQGLITKICIAIIFISKWSCRQNSWSNKKRFRQVIIIFQIKNSNRFSLKFKCMRTKFISIFYLSRHRLWADTCTLYNQLLISKLHATHTSNGLQDNSKIQYLLFQLTTLNPISFTIILK